MKKFTTIRWICACDKTMVWKNVDTILFSREPTNKWLLRELPEDNLSDQLL